MAYKNLKKALSRWNLAIAIIFVLFFVAILLTAIFAIPPVILPITIRASPLTTFDLNWTLIPFSIITAIFHFVAFFDLWDYSKLLLCGGQSQIRWTEYAVTNTLMMITVAAVSGVSDVSILFFVIPFANIAMQWFGLQHERSSDYTMAYLWWGFLPWAVIWAPIIIALFDGGAVAGWATAAAVFSFIASFAFPAVLLWRANVASSQANNYRAEVGFFVLSLTAKIGLDLVIIIGRAL